MVKTFVEIKVWFRDHNNEIRWNSFEYWYQAQQFADSLGRKFIKFENVMIDNK